VEVPPRLREHLLGRLEAERGAWYRRWYGHGIRALAAAAALLLVLWGWWHWRTTHRPEVDVASVYEQVNLRQRSRETVSEYLRWEGVGSEVQPPGYNYAFLIAYGMSELPGQRQRVPLLVFVRNDHRPATRALVYILSPNQFKLDGLPGGDFSSDPGYTYKLAIDRADPTGCAYLVFYTGEEWDWLKPPAQGG
jgi:hypothetical protein